MYDYDHICSLLIQNPLIKSCCCCCMNTVLLLHSRWQQHHKIQKNKINCVHAVSENAAPSSFLEVKVGEVKMQISSRHFPPQKEKKSPNSDCKITGTITGKSRLKQCNVLLFWVFLMENGCAENINDSTSAGECSIMILKNICRCIPVMLLCTSRITAFAREGSNNNHPMYSVLQV